MHQLGEHQLGEARPSAGGTEGVSSSLAHVRRPERGLGRLRREEGQAAWEFVLLFPLMVVLLLLFVDLGILTYEYVSVSNAVREGARYASTTCLSTSPPGCSAVEIQTRTAERSAGFLKTSPAPVCGTAPSAATDADEICVNWVIPTTSTNRKDRGDSVIVSANHMYDFLFLPFQIRVVACADMRLETRDVTAYDGSGPEDCN